MDSGTAYYAGESVIRLGAIALVPRERTPAATRSWLLLIFFLPVPGLLLFLAIGKSHFPPGRVLRYRQSLPFFQDVNVRLEPPKTADFEESNPIAALAKRLGLFAAVSGNTVELIDDYDLVMERLVADIDSARRYVRILLYIFADDKVGRRIGSALRRAVKRGVSCQVMVDLVGSHRWIHGTMLLLAEAGVEVRKALPFRLLRGRTRRDMRNHSKLFVIDGYLLNPVRARTSLTGS